MMHIALLRNAATGRYYPMPFHPAPRPSDDVEDGKVCRHRSTGHHIDGFANKADAEAVIAGESAAFCPTGLVLGWNGAGIPATTLDLPLLPAAGPEVQHG